MTAILDRFTGTSDEPERTPLTAPPPFSRTASPVPWWAGVYGLDPALPVEDWSLAAQHTAMACAVHVFGTDAGYAEKVFSRKGSPAAQFTAWLMQDAGPEGAGRRRLALRLICEHAALADVSRILSDADELCKSCSPGARPR